MTVWKVIYVIVHEYVCFMDLCCMYIYRCGFIWLCVYMYVCGGTCLFSAWFCSRDSCGSLWSEYTTFS